MSPNLSCQRAARLCGFLLFALLGAAGAGAQETLPPAAPSVSTPQPAIRPDPDGNGSNYMHPVLTWVTWVRPLYRVSDLRREAEADRTFERKLQRIILPHMEFRGTKVSEAIEHLRQESIRLDDTADPTARGVKISVRYPASLFPDEKDRAPAPTWEAIEGLPTPPPPREPRAHTAPGDTPINLTLGRLPLLEALRYLATQAGLQVKVRTGRIDLVPDATECGIFTSAEFRVRPEDVGLPPSTSSLANYLLPGVGIRRFDQRNVAPYLKARGIYFPEGCSAVYLPSTGSLIVRNNPINIEEIKKLLASPPGTNSTSPTNP